MAFKLASEAAAAWAAVILTGAGGIATTAIHYGSTNAKITAIEQKQQATEAHVAKHDDQLTEIQKLQAAQGQALKDIQDTVHDMHDNGVKRK